MSAITPAEAEAKLREVFVRDRADYIIISSRRQEFAIQVANYGVEQGWLTGKWNDDDVQSTYVTYRLTEKGREHFGIGGGE